MRSPSPVRRDRDTGRRPASADRRHHARHQMRPHLNEGPVVGLVERHVDRVALRDRITEDGAVGSVTSDGTVDECAAVRK